MIRRILPVLLFLFGPAFAPVGALVDTLSSVRARGELIWGGDMKGGEPYVFEDPKDRTRVVGFEVDIAREYKP